MRFRLALPTLTAAFALLGACSGDGATEPNAEPTAEPFLGCSAVQSISVGSTVSGSLSTSDCRLPFDNSFIDYYELRLSTGRTVTITMSSSQFDTFIVLFDRASGTPIAADDDGGDGTNSRLQISLDAGTYIIGANSFLVGATGSYQLAVN